MKIIKRIFTITLIFVMSLLLFKFENKTQVFANSNSESYGNIILGFENLSYAKIEKLKVDIYNATPIYENNKIVRFNHEYFSSYELTQEGIVVKKPSEYLLLKVNLEDIPSEYGVDNQSYFVTSDCEVKYFKIKKIDNVSVVSNNNQKSVVFKSSNDEIIFAKYNLSCEDSLWKVTNFNKTYFIPMTNYEDEELLENYESESYNLDPVYRYYPSDYENDNYGFVVKYDENTMSEENAIKVFNIITDINQYFCLNDDMGFSQPKTSNTEFLIELVLKENIDSVNNNKVGAITYSSLNENNKVESYIKLQYEYLTTLIPSKINDYKIILAHEYFHAIIAEMTNLSNLLGFDGINESLSTCMAILYASDKNIESSSMRTEYKNYMKQFYNVVGNSFDVFQNNASLYYSGFIFPLYLYERFGINIIKDIILNYEYSNNSLDVYYEVLDTYNKDFRTIFYEFSKDCLFAEYNYPSIDEYYTSMWNANEIEYSNLSSKTAMYEKTNLNTTYLSNTYIRTKFETCEYHDMFITVEVTGSSNYNLIYGTLGDNGFETFDASIEERLITIPCYNYGSESKREWRCTINNNTASQEQTTIDYTITLVHKDLSIALGEVKSAVTHFHNKMTEVRYKFVPQTTSLYEFTINTIDSNNVSMNGMFLKVIDKNNEVLAQTENSVTFENSINIYATLIMNEIYYLVVEYIPNNSKFYSKCDISINFLEKQLNLEFNNEVECNEWFVKQGDNGIYVNSSVNGIFTTYIQFNEMLDVSFNCKIYELIGNSLNILSQNIFNDSNNNLSFNIQLNKNHKYYIMFENVPISLNYSINLERYIQNNIELQTDHSENVTLGSEVRLRGSELNGTTITEGYTRCLYIFSDGEYKSRLSYDLISANESVAIVSEYGTIIAKPVSVETKVKIIAINKNNYGEYGSIELTIMPDLSNEIKIIELTTDCRIAGNQYGTEVSVKGGNPGENTIHVGFTRLLCFKSGNPSDSIQDFIWTTSNNNIATVSVFGTIVGVGRGQCIIEGTYKYNSNFHATIIVEIL